MSASKFHWNQGDREQDFHRNLNTTSHMGNVQHVLAVRLVLVYLVPSEEEVENS